MRVRAIAHEAYLASLNALLRVPCHPLRLGVVRKWARNEVGLDVSIERGLELYSKGGLTIGHNCNINANVILDGRGGLRIGRYVTIAPGVAILTADHDPHTPEFSGRLRPVTVGDNVWIATRAMILPGSIIGNGAVVAAGSVVHGVVPEWTIVAGNPAGHIADRSRLGGPPTEVYRRWFH